MTVVFYNLKEDTVKEIENFIKSRDSDASFFSSGSLTEIKKVIEKEDKSILVFKRQDIKRGDMVGIKQELEGTKSLSVHFVEIDENEIENAGGRVLAKLMRLENSKIHPKSLKPSKKIVLDEKVSRREMLNIFSKLIKPRYEVIPYVSDSNFCKFCSICVSSCPLGAVYIEKGNAHIDKDKCNGCGLCVNSCPANTIIFPTMEEIEVEIETLLVESSKPVIEFHCNRGGTDNFNGDRGSLPVEVPCAWMCSLPTMLKSFLFADVSIRCVEDCRYSNNYYSNFNFINFIGKISEKIDRQEIRKIKNKKQYLKEKSLKKLILKLKEDFKIKGAIENAPFGFINIEQEKCTACGLCAEICPRNALILDNGAEELNISFDNLRCTACGLCKKICPENAIIIKRILNFDNLNTTLMKSEYIRCKLCNNIIAPLNLNKKINSENLEHCPSCRIMNQLK